MKVAIVKYNAGNIYSVDHALKRLGVEASVTADAQQLQQADKVIFPGVGEAATTMDYLHQTGLDVVIRSLRQPVLGICLGMQLLCRHTEEGDVDGLGIFDVDIKKFRAETPSDKVPHMGWNTLEHTRGPLFAQLLRTRLCLYGGRNRLYPSVQRRPAEGQFLCHAIPS